MACSDSEQPIPYLPLDHPEPLAAILGVMHYPGTDKESSEKARAFAAKFLLAQPLRAFIESGGELPQETLIQIALDAGIATDDWRERHFAGTATGQMFKVYFALYRTDPSLASWANAQRIAELITRSSAAPGSQATLYKLRGSMMTVAHLWAAWILREGRWTTAPEVGYEGWQDVQSFIAEAETFRQWGQTWRPDREKAEPPLPPDAWETPPDWAPPMRKPGWPRTGGIPDIGIDADLIRRAGIRPAGRPKGTAENPL